MAESAQRLTRDCCAHRSLDRPDCFRTASNYLLSPSAQSDVEISAENGGCGIGAGTDIIAPLVAQRWTLIRLSRLSRRPGAYQAVNRKSQGHLQFAPTGDGKPLAFIESESSVEMWQGRRGDFQPGPPTRLAERLRLRH